MRAEKLQLVQDIAALLGSSTHLFLVSYKGLTVEQFAALRAELREVGAECHVVPNRLLRKAAESAGLDCLAGAELVGDTAIVTNGNDPVAVAKRLRTFARTAKGLEIKLGALESKLLQAAEVHELAELPPREVLQAVLLGVLQAPARNLACVLQQKTATIVYVLQAYIDSKQDVA